jgi:SAM-dependent methyltransferase
MAILSETERAKLDPGDDVAFYDTPRFVTHADDGFLARLTDLYAAHLNPGDRVFDAMSSWVSHLPDIPLGRVVGHGLNAEELAANDAFDTWFVQNFNETQSLPLAEGSVDAVLCALSVQYLQYPEATFEEFARVLASDGTLIVAFTNRMFPTKAVRAWRTASMDDRLALVGRYVDATGAFDSVETVRERPDEDPFYAVVARKSP